MAINPSEIRRRFAAPAADADRDRRKTEITAAAENLALLINQLVPGSREESEAITHLEEAVFWAHAGIDRRGPRRPHVPAAALDRDAAPTPPAAPPPQETNHT